MTQADELELHRVSALLQEIDASLPDASPLREGLVKAGLALSVAFFAGRRGWIEETYGRLVGDDDDPSDTQRAPLNSIGIDPDAAAPAE